MKKSLLLMLAMVMSLGMAMAETITLKTNSSASTWTGDKNGYTTTIDGWTVSYQKNQSSNDCVAPSADHIRVYGKANLVIAGPNGETITNVVLHVTASSYAVEMTCNGDDTDKAKANTTDKTITWSGAATTFTATGSKQVRVSSIDVTYEGADVAVKTPVISGESFFEGTNAVTIEGEDGTTIYYTLDGTDPTTASPLTGASPLTFSLTESAEVKAIAVKGADQSSVASKSFTAITSTDATIASINELSADAKWLNVTFNNAKVTYKSGNSTFLREGDKAIIVYGSSIKFPVNAIVSGSVKMDYDNYNGIHEIIDNALTTDANLTITESDEKAEPTKTTVAELLALDHICDYVVVENVLIDSIGNSAALIQGTDSIALYKGINVSAYAGTGKPYTVVAAFNSIYNGNAQLLPISVTDYVPTGIAGIEATEQKSVIFTLDGRRVAAPVKGINIINGKKVMVL